MELIAGIEEYVYVEEFEQRSVIYLQIYQHFAGAELVPVKAIRVCHIDSGFYQAHLAEALDKVMEWITKQGL